MAKSSAKKRLCSYGVIFRTVLILAVCLCFFYIVGRQWKHPKNHPKRKKINFHRSVNMVKTTVISSSCPRCSCDCLPEIDSIALPLDYADCAKNNPEMNEEMKKDAITLLSEEISLHKNVTRDSLNNLQQSIMDAKQASTKYQKEAEKCNTGQKVCEEAREKAQAELRKELKLSALWEQRAREFGWTDE